jgi:hypothetical protein
MRAAVVKRFVAQQNIENFKAALASESDPERRAVLERLLAEEEARLDQARADAVSEEVKRPKAS